MILISPHGLDLRRTHQNLFSAQFNKSHSLFVGLEKSTKDLHRQSVSLQRLKSVMNEGIEKSTKSIGKMFQELREA